MFVLFAPTELQFLVSCVDWKTRLADDAKNAIVGYMAARPSDKLDDDALLDDVFRHCKLA